MGKHHTNVCLGPTLQAFDPQTTTPPPDPNHSPQTSKGGSHSQVHASLVPINLANVLTNSGQVSLMKTVAANLAL